IDLGRTSKQVEKAPYPLALSLLLELAVDGSASLVQNLTLAVGALQGAVGATSDAREQRASSSSNDAGLIVATFDPEEWLDVFDEATERMHDGREQEAVELFEQAFALMYRDRT